MTINEANLLLTLFLSQHKGKRICDVIPLTVSRAIITNIVYNRNRAELRGKLTSFPHNVLLTHYSNMHQSYRILNREQNGYVGINLLDYISFEDKV